MKIVLSRSWAVNLAERNPAHAKAIISISVIVNLLIMSLIVFFIIHYFFVYAASNFHPIQLKIDNILVYFWIAVFAELIVMTAISQKRHKEYLADSFSAVADAVFLMMLFYLVIVPLVPFP